MNPSPHISIIIPAHNEAQCIGSVLDEIFEYFSQNKKGTKFEVIVVDNGSTDDTPEIAKNHGAKVIQEPRLGYGQACWRGIQASKGDTLAFVDGDGAVDIQDIDPLLDTLKLGADLAIGVRSNTEPESLTLPQRFGNLLACWLIRVIWRFPVYDLGPFRVLRRQFFDQLNMQDRDYGWTIEMQILAYQRKAKVVDVPVTWRSRIAGDSKISGTIRGVMFAGRDIMGMIFRQWWRQQASKRKSYSTSKFQKPYTSNVQHRLTKNEPTSVRRS